MAKYTGNYTSEAVKVIKKSERLECQMVEDGTCYICTGAALFKMTPPEYDAIVRPVVCCDAGDWAIIQGDRGERRADILKIWNDSLENSKGAATMEACPMVFRDEKREVVGLYSADGGFAATYNAAFISAIRAGVRFVAKSNTSGAIAYDRDNFGASGGAEKNQGNHPEGAEGHSSGKENRKHNGALPQHSGHFRDREGLTD